MHDVYRFCSFGLSRAALALVFLIASALASPDSAAQVFEVDLEAGAESQGVLINSVAQDSGSSTVSLSHSHDLDGADGLAKAAAGPGSVAVFGRARYSVLDPNNDTSSFANATAIATMDDVTLAGSGSMNNVNMYLDLSGSMHVFGTTDVALSSLSLTVKLGAQTVHGFRTVQLPLFYGDDGILNNEVWASGATSFSGTIAAGPFDNVPTNTPLTVELGITIGAFAQIFEPSLIGNAAIATGDIGNTLNFTSTGSVFTSNGNPISVESVQGSITGGLWTGTPVSVPQDPAPVPLLSTPMTLLLALVIGCSGLLLRSRPRAS